MTQTREADRPRGDARGGPLTRLRRFVREVVAELRKVVWPGRSDLLRYTLVVVVFVSVLMAYIAGVDVLVSRGAAALFGG